MATNKGDTLIHRGLTFTVRHARDDHDDPPWTRDDGRGVVTEWVSAARYDETQWRVLNTDHGSTRYFDQAATLAKATAEGWGLSPERLEALAQTQNHPPTPAEIIAEAVEQEFLFLDGWCSGAWEYIGVIVTLPGTTISRSLWGIESSEHAYLAEVARELADQIISEGIDEIEAEINRLNQIRATVGAATRTGSVEA